MPRPQVRKTPEAIQRHPGVITRGEFPPDIQKVLKEEGTTVITTTNIAGNAILGKIIGGKTSQVVFFSKSAIDTGSRVTITGRMPLPKDSRFQPSSWIWRDEDGLIHTILSGALVTQEEKYIQTEDRETGKPYLAMGPVLFVKEGLVDPVIVPRRGFPSLFRPDDTSLVRVLIEFPEMARIQPRYRPYIGIQTPVHDNVFERIRVEDKVFPLIVDGVYLLLLPLADINREDEVSTPDGGRGIRIRIERTNIEKNRLIFLYDPPEGEQLEEARILRRERSRVSAEEEEKIVYTLVVRSENFAPIRGFPGPIIRVLKVTIPIKDVHDRLVKKATRKEVTTINIAKRLAEQEQERERPKRARRGERGDEIKGIKFITTPTIRMPVVFERSEATAKRDGIFVVTRKVVSKKEDAEGLKIGGTSFHIVFFYPREVVVSNPVFRKPDGEKIGPLEEVIARLLEAQKWGSGAEGTVLGLRALPDPRDDTVDIWLAITSSVDNQYFLDIVKLKTKIVGIGREGVDIVLIEGSLLGRLPGEKEVGLLKEKPMSKLPTEITPMEYGRKDDGRLPGEKEVDLLKEKPMSKLPTEITPMEYGRKDDGRRLRLTVTTPYQTALIQG